MKSLTQIREMLCRELDGLAKLGDITPGTLETVHKITDTMKNIDKIMMLEEGGYSGDDMSSRGSYAGGGSYRGSYAGGSYDDGSYSGYSRSGQSMRGGYSATEETEMFRKKINELMRQGNMSGEDRRALQRAVQIIGER